MRKAASVNLNGMHQWISVHVSWHRARTSLDEHMSICDEFAQSTATSVKVNGMHQWIIVHVSWHRARTSLDERISTCNEFAQSTTTSATTYIMQKWTRVYTNYTHWKALNHAESCNSIGRVAAQSNCVLEPTDGVRCAMHTWIICRLFDNMQDLGGGFWQDLVVEKLKDVTFERRRFVRESTVVPTACRTFAANFSSPCWCSRNINVAMHN